MAPVRRDALPRGKKEAIRVTDQIRPGESAHDDDTDDDTDDVLIEEISIDGMCGVY